MEVFGDSQSYRAHWMLNFEKEASVIVMEVDSRQTSWGPLAFLDVMGASAVLETCKLPAPLVKV